MPKPAEGESGATKRTESATRLLSRAPANVFGVDEFEKGSRYAEYDRLLHTYARRYACDLDEEADLVQDTWMLIWLKRDQLRDDRRFGAWMLRLCRTVCLRHLRARQRRLKFETLASQAPIQAISEEDAQSTQDREDALLDVVLSLTERQQLVLLLREVAELSVNQVAALLHCAPGTVKAIRNQAIKRLRARTALTLIRSSETSSDSC